MFCDGKNTPEEMVLEAIRLATALKKMYAHKIWIQLGVGQDYFASAADVYSKTKCQIVEYFDLVMKHISVG